MQPNAMSVLLVEDEFLIALDAKQILEDCGATSIEVASSYEEAERCAQEAQFDVAVLDVNLNGHMSFPIAKLIKKRGIPVILASGYALLERQLSGLDGVLCITKPYSPAQLQEALRAALSEV